MPSDFRYRAVNRAGEHLSGTLRAESAAEVSLRLDRMGYIPLAVHRELAAGLRAFLRNRERAPLPALIVFTQQFGTLYRAGIPILGALGILERQCDHAVLRRALEEVRADLVSGVGLGDAFFRRERVFGRLVCASIHAGEASGQLDHVLDRLGEYLERELKMREELRDALRYPGFVAAAIVGALVVMVVVVLPKFAAFYASAGAALPLPSRMIIRLGEFMRAHGLLILGAAIPAALAWRFWVNTGQGREWVDRLGLRLPVVGKVILKVAISRFAHMLSILLKGGLPLVEALTVVRGVVGNRAVAIEIERLETGFVEGREVVRLLERSPVLPPLAAQMFAVGLESGSLDRMLVQMARHYDRDVEYATRRFTRTAEPLFTLVLGVAVLVLALAVLLPMWSLLEVYRP